MSVYVPPLLRELYKSERNMGVYVPPLLREMYKSERDMCVRAPEWKFSGYVPPHGDRKIRENFLFCQIFFFGQRTFSQFFWCNTIHLQAGVDRRN